MSKILELPNDLYKKIEERIKGTEFKSVEEYVIFVLEEVLKDEEESESLSPEEEAQVKERLKGLGYL
ncbi:MAG TPA: CopG family transcriptional regulator [Candidatus Desulfofervidus auxilii]|uniref:CopG family transcriptional regulator n=1 Tax=Desulfofervidus auxilii TaxID=1621989 RepID=A0A7C1VW29_DESA2|nr:CopG family transcriptional regulator [Candidatus Desulfofervidus auxilii]